MGWGGTAGNRIAIEFQNCYRILKLESTSVPPFNESMCIFSEEETWEEPKKGKGRGKGNGSWKNDWTQEERFPVATLQFATVFLLEIRPCLKAIYLRDNGGLRIIP